MPPPHTYTWCSLAFVGYLPPPKRNICTDFRRRWPTSWSHRNLSTQICWVLVFFKESDHNSEVRWPRWAGVDVERAHKRDRWTSRFSKHLGVGFSKQRAGGGLPNPPPTHLTTLKTQTRSQLVDRKPPLAKDRDLLSYVEIPRDDDNCVKKKLNKKIK